MPRPPSDDEIRRRYGLPPGTRIVRLTPDALGRVTVSPDSFAYVTTRPLLDSTAWDRPVAVAGSTVRLDVQTVFVGEGTPEIPAAQVDVTLRDARNKVVGRGHGPVSRDRATVAVELDRRAAGLCAADVVVRDLGLKGTSPPLTVLPFAELDRARWGQGEARDGDAVALSCRVTGTAEGVGRLEGQAAEVEVLRGEEGGGDGLVSLFEPVTTLRVPVQDGRIEVVWRVGYEADGKAQIATQAEHDTAAERTGRTAGRYRRPAYRFRVRVAGLSVESDVLGYRDHVELAWDDDTDRPAAGAAVAVRLADGTARDETLGDDGRLRLADVPPGPVEAVFGPDPREWEPDTPFRATEPGEAPFDYALALAPAPPVLLASAALDPALLAELAGDPDDDGDDFVGWLWGTLIGDFNEDPSYEEIAGAMALSFVPVAGTLFDIRDIVANLYLLTKDRGWEDTWRWVALVVTLVGFFPVVGDVVKGAFRFVYKGLRARAADAAAGSLEPAARLLAAAFARWGRGNPRLWFERYVDLGAVLTEAQSWFDRASGKVLGVFGAWHRKIQDRVDQAARAHEALAGLVVTVWERVGGEARPVTAPRVVRDLRRALRSLGGALAEVERARDMGRTAIRGAFRELEAGLAELFDEVDRLGLAVATEGVSGSRIRPPRLLESDLLGPNRLYSQGRTYDGGNGPGYRGRLRGEDVVLPGVPTERMTLTKLTREERRALRADFDGRERGAFLRGLADDPAKVEQLRAAGLTDDQIALMRAGRGPGGNWQVHHKVPLDLGGTNDFDNLVIMQHEPYHKVITNAQNSLGLDVGSSATVDWPMPPGFIYPPNPIP